MTPYCERWYRGVAVWFWLLFVGGHLVFYCSAATCYLLLSYYPLDELTAASILSTGSSFLSATWLPFSYVLVRCERRDIVTNLIFQLGCGFSLICILSSLGLASTFSESKAILQKKTVASLRGGVENSDSKAVPGWFNKIQLSYKCCGLEGPYDYLDPGDLDFLRPPQFCSSAQVPAQAPSNSLKGCLDLMIQRKQIIQVLTIGLDVGLMVGSVGSSALHAVWFYVIRKQALIVLTGSVYLHGNNDDLKVYPEVESSEAVSLSSDDDE